MSNSILDSSVLLICIAVHYLSTLALTQAHTLSIQLKGLE